jgi:hypothetical protein
LQGASQEGVQKAVLVETRGPGAYVGLVWSLGLWVGSAGRDGLRGAGCGLPGSADILGLGWAALGLWLGYGL